MKTRIVEVPFIYDITFVPKGARKPREITLRDVVHVEMRTPTEAEAPVSFRVSGSIYEIQSKDMLDLRTTEEGHWRPLLRGWSGNESILSQEIVFAEIARGADPIFRVDFHQLEKAKKVEDLGEGRIETSTRDKEIARFHDRARDVLLIGGLVYIPCEEPVWEPNWSYLGKSLEARPLQAKDEFGAAMDVIPAHRIDLVREALQLPLECDLSSIECFGVIEVLLPDCVRFRHNEEPRLRATADAAPDKAKKFVAENVDRLTPELLNGYQRLRKDVLAAETANEKADALRAFLPLIAEIQDDNSYQLNSWLKEIKEALSSWDAFVIERDAETDIGLSM